MKRTITLLGTVATLGVATDELSGRQHEGHAMPEPARRWTLSTMGQLFPILTAGEPFDRDARYHGREVYLTQPALMAALTSPSGRWNLRATLDFEQLTQPDGEITFGGWGEGFIDRRHPHTILHELIVSWSVRAAAGGDAWSLSAGKGFAPYGTEDPMGRAGVKYPTNHHLSQILERWLVTGTWTRPDGWSLEAGVFGGTEPEDAYDLSNIRSFGDSWSVRVARRLGRDPADRPWEASASFAHVSEEHADGGEVTRLANIAVRFEAPGRLSGLVEASRSWPEEDEGYWAVLGEARLTAGRHRPYGRAEWATRPEYHRLGEPGSDLYYRYDHDGHADGATRWLILTGGYGFEASTGSVSTLPFVEVQYHHVRAERGPVTPDALFGRSGLWAVSTGIRLYFGGGPMRMGRYGALDPMAYHGAAPAGAHGNH